MDNRTPTQKADDFIQNETQFHLGALVTEQSHPRSRGLSQLLASSSRDGILMLLKIDDDLMSALDRIVVSDAFKKLADDMLSTLSGGGRIIFSGCGATGRLAIELDAANRRWWRQCFEAMPSLRESCGTLAEQTFAVMTGGDFALIRSVESFEDYISFGYRQMESAGVSKNDMVVAISEGGETSSVIGTIHAGLDAGASVHFLFDNPAELLCSFVERSRKVIEDPRVNVADLTTGPMAVAGSTRMQATTMELIVAGMAFEDALGKLLVDRLAPETCCQLGLTGVNPPNTVKRVKTLLAELREEANLDALARYIDFESNLYREHGRVTYFADEYLIDIFTDTTERAPTFKTPPFRSALDTQAPAPWAFVKDPLRDTKNAWLHVLEHRPRCLNWTPEDYRQMNAGQQIIDNPPRVSEELLYTFMIGCEADASRTEVSPNAAVAVLVGNENAHLGPKADAWKEAFDRQTAAYDARVALVVGPKSPDDAHVFAIKIAIPRSPLNLFAHLGIKLVLNNLSTAIMGKIGRLSSNWMAHVEASNKKLI
ncbi:MAG: hypothetical protein PHQ75_08165, partial [Thermoguttaceae bacterium]|nr:hypothetical protein [Thermoguttaceae bacterium]